MKVDSALGIARAGMARAYQGIYQSAGEIARATAPADSPELTRAFVNIMQHRQQLEAAAKVVETVDHSLAALFPPGKRG